MQRYDIFSKNNQPFPRKVAFTDKTWTKRKF